MKLNWNFLRGERFQNKILPWWCHGYFLEQHIALYKCNVVCINSLSPLVQKLGNTVLQINHYPVDNVIMLVCLIPYLFD